MLVSLILHPFAQTRKYSSDIMIGLPSVFSRQVGKNLKYILKIEYKPSSMVGVESCTSQNVLLLYQVCRCKLTIVINIPVYI